MLIRQNARGLAIPVSLSGAMTPLASNSPMQKGRTGEFVVRTRKRRLHSAAVTIHAIRERRQIPGNLARLRVSRSHSPASLLRIPVDRSLKQKSLHREQIASRFSTRPNEIQQLILPTKLLAFALVAHPRVLVLLVDAIAHT